jgi:hypothetical protein
LSYTAGASDVPKPERLPGQGKQKLKLFPERAIEKRDEVQKAPYPFYFIPPSQQNSAHHLFFFETLSWA